MRLLSLLCLSLLAWAGSVCGKPKPTAPGQLSMTARPHKADTAASASASVRALAPGDTEADRYTHLTEEDFETVARELGVEVAAIKAVVLIEAGKEMKGFYAPGVPVVNFDQSMYRSHAAKAPDRRGDKSAKVPSGLTGYALREWTQLTNARRVNEQGANMGAFWGMFQIGGFNYKLCGCKDVNEFVRLMSESEFAQLELFARFITNAGMLNDLKAKNWSAFARKYNGASYARRGYHTRMAAAYNKFKRS